VIPTPFGFFEVERELVSADTALFGQPGFGKARRSFRDFSLGAPGYCMGGVIYLCTSF
jgi:hypothetical protein